MLGFYAIGGEAIGANPAIVADAIVNLTSASSTQSANSGTGAAAVTPSTPPPSTVNLTANSATQGAESSAGAVIVTPAAPPPLPINPRMLYVAGRSSNFAPMRPGEVEVLTIDFGPALADGEAILSAVWSNSASDGMDPNPAAMIRNRMTIAGAKVSELFAASVAGVTYSPICTIQTSKGQTLIQPEFGAGLLYVSG